MAVYDKWWRFSQDGASFRDMPSPSELDYSFNDLDNNSYRSVVTGVLIRNRIRKRVGKWEFSFDAISAQVLSEILEATENEYFFIQVRNGDELTSTKKVYSGAPKIKPIKGTQRFNLSFSLIEY